MKKDDEALDHGWLLDNDTDAGAVSKQYDDWASSYDQELSEWGYRSPEEAAKLLAVHAEPSARVLDAGCGTGLAGVALAAEGFREIVGIDISAESVKLAADRGVYQSVHEGDLQRPPLPFTENAFDALACVGVLTYIEDVATTFVEFCRVVRSGGPIVFTCRDDLYRERDYEGATAKLIESGKWRRLHRSTPLPYLPGNADFGDRIRVIYSAYEVLDSR